MVKLGRNHPLVKYVTKQNRCATCIPRTNIVPVPPVPPVPPPPCEGGLFRSNEDLERLRGCTTINGFVYIINDEGNFTNENPPDFSVFDNLEVINGTEGEFGNAFAISINGVSFSIVDKFNKLTTCDSSITIINCDLLESISGFGALTTVGGVFNITNNLALTTITGFSALQSISASFSITNNLALTEISGFSALQSISSSFSITNNLALTTISGFSALQSISSSFDIANNLALTEISGFGALQTINGVFNILINPLLTEISGFSALQTINGDVMINANSFTPNLILNVCDTTYSAINAAIGSYAFIDLSSFTTNPC